MDNIYEDDIPKYKKASQSKAPPKAKHKHLAEPCVLSYPKDWYQKEHLRSEERQFTIEYYCPICGKIMGLRERDRWYKTHILKGFSCWDVQTEECLKELNPKTRTIPHFEVDSPFDKFVSL